MIVVETAEPNLQCFIDFSTGVAVVDVEVNAKAMLSPTHQAVWCKKTQALSENARQKAQITL